jgi:hypothetical protein
MKCQTSSGANNFVGSYVKLLKVNEKIVFTVTPESSVRRLLVTACVFSSSPILVTLMKEELSSSEISVPTRATRRNIPEDTILHSHRRENLKSYIALTGWTL